MRAEFYQVIGSGPWMVDHPNGDAISHRPGEIFEARPTNKSVIRGLRAKRLRQLNTRESDARRAAKAVVAVTPKAGPPQQPAVRKPQPAPKPTSGSGE